VPHEVRHPGDLTAALDELLPQCLVPAAVADVPLPAGTGIAVSNFVEDSTKMVFTFSIPFTFVSFSSTNFS
jgi:hypothetical protein